MNLSPKHLWSKIIYTMKNLCKLFYIYIFFPAVSHFFALCTYYNMGKIRLPQEKIILCSLCPMPLCPIVSYCVLLCPILECKSK